MKLKEFIKQVGAPTIAKELKVTRQAVFQWASGETVPTLENALKLIKLSKGKLTTNSFKK